MPDAGCRISVVGDFIYSDAGWFKLDSFSYSDARGLNSLASFIWIPDAGSFNSKAFFSDAGCKGLCTRRLVCSTAGGHRIREPICRIDLDRTLKKEFLLVQRGGAVIQFTNFD